MDSRSHNQIRSHFYSFSTVHVPYFDSGYQLQLSVNTMCEKKNQSVPLDHYRHRQYHMLEPALYNNLRKKIRGYEILAPSSSRLELCPQYKVDTKINDSTDPNYKFFENRLKMMHTVDET